MIDARLRIGFDLDLDEHPVKDLVNYVADGSIYEPLQTWLNGFDPSFPGPEIVTYPVPRLNKLHYGYLTCLLAPNPSKEIVQDSTV